MSNVPPRKRFIDSNPNHPDEIPHTATTAKNASAAAMPKMAPRPERCVRTSQNTSKCVSNA
jgi:hypothetical protein